MKILHVTPGLGLGGTERVVQNYAIGLMGRSHEVAVLSLQDDGARGEALRNAGVRVAALGMKIGQEAGILREKWDVVHIHRAGCYHPFETEVLERLRAHNCCPIIETSVFGRRDETMKPGMITLHLQLTEWCLFKWARWETKETRHQLGVVLPNALEPGAFYRRGEEDVRFFKASLGIPADALVVGRIGAVSDPKWHSGVVDLFCRLPCAIQGRPVYGLFVGAPRTVAARAVVLEAAIGGRLVNVPPRMDDAFLAKAYSAIDVFVHMARIGESFGMVIAESLLCETPVVTLSTPCRDNSQVVLVRHGKSGWVANRAEEMVRYTVSMLADTAARRRFGAAGRRDIMNDYSVEKISGRLETVYRHAVSSPGASQREQLAALLEGEGFMTSRNVSRSLDFGALGVRMGVFESVCFRAAHSGWAYRQFQKSKRLRAKWI